MMTKFDPNDVVPTGETIMITTALMTYREFSLPILGGLVDVLLGPPIHPDIDEDDTDEDDCCESLEEYPLQGDEFAVGNYVRVRYLAGDNAVTDLWFKVTGLADVDRATNRQEVTLKRIFGGETGQIVPTRVLVANMGAPLRADERRRQGEP